MTNESAELHPVHRLQADYRDLRARIEALADEWERRAGEVAKDWGQAIQAPTYLSRCDELRALLDDPAPEPVTDDELASALPDDLDLPAVGLARRVLDRFHVTRRAES